MFDLSSEQTHLVASVRQLMDRYAPDEVARELDEQHQYPYDIYKHFADADLLSIPFEPEIGGGGGSIFDMVLVAEEVGRKGYDYVAVYGTPVFIALNIAEYGSQAQKEAFLPRFFAGDIRFAVSISEPDAGSDAGSMRMSAKADGDHFVLNGQKTWTSGGAVDNTVICVYAVTGERGDRRGLSCFLVDNDTPGLEIRRIDTLGRRMFATTELFFDNVQIPTDRLIGEVGDGWKIMLSGLQFERIVTSAAYVGNSQEVIDVALAYAKERHQFGKPIGDFQAISHMFADMQTSVSAARLLTYDAAQALDRDGTAVQAVSMAKLFGSETFQTVARQGVQILGGYGYSMESSMQRHLRAAIGATITAGTSQMQRQTIARRMGLRPQ